MYYIHFVNSLSPRSESLPIATLSSPHPLAGPPPRTRLGQTFRRGLRGRHSNLWVTAHILRAYAAHDLLAAGPLVGSGSAPSSPRSPAGITLAPDMALAGLCARASVLAASLPGRQFLLQGFKHPVFSSPLPERASAPPATSRPAGCAFWGLQQPEKCDSEPTFYPRPSAVEPDRSPTGVRRQPDLSDRLPKPDSGDRNRT